MRLIHPETFDGSRSIAPKASTRRKANVDGVTYVEGQRPTFKAIKVEEQAFTSKENVEKKQNHQTESKKRVRAAIKPSASDCEEVPQSAKRKREWKKKTEPEISTLPVENVPLVAVESLVDLFPPEKKTEAELRYFTITSLKINWTTENAYQYIPALHNGNSVLAPNLKQAIELAARSTSSDIVFRSFPLLGPLGRFLVLHNGEYLHPRIMEIMVSEAMKYLVAAYGPKEGASISTTPGMGYIVSYNNLLFLQELTASLRPFTLSDWDRANFVNIEAWLRNPESYLFFSSERDWKIFNIAKYNFLSNHNRSNGGVQEFNGLAEETRDGMIGDASKWLLTFNTKGTC